MNGSYIIGVGIYSFVPPSSTPPAGNAIQTESGDDLTTESGDTIVTEDSP